MYKYVTWVHLGFLTTAREMTRVEERREITKMSARGKALRLLVKIYFTITDIWQTLKL
jgi:hypothetical protein